MPLIFIFFNKANLKHSHNLLVIDIDKKNNNKKKTAITTQNSSKLGNHTKTLI
jgi:hypothetical protein